MVRRPASMGQLVKDSLSLVGGILLEIMFILWTIILIMGTAGIALLVWQLVG
ncbi:MAG: hypothetical protein OEV21_03445 [Thermoplasmata archaeon]|nr:hypothetical protein [Thermoplasmata archaeon]